MNDAMSKLVGQIYEATLDRSIWPKVLEDFSALTGARGAHILLFDRDNKVALGEIGKLPAECHQEYAERYAVLDPRTTRAVAWPDHVIWRDEDLMSEDELRQSPTHQELFRKFDIHRAIGAKNRVAANGWFTAVVTTWPGGPDFSSEHVSRFETIYPHLERAARIAMLMPAVDHAAQLAGAAIENLDLGCIVCDVTGYVHYANAHAELSIASGDCLKVVSGRIGAQQNSATEMLRGLVATVARTGMAAGGRILHKVAGLIELYVLPARPHSNPQFSEPMAIIIFRDPEQLSTPSQRAMQELFALTPSESRLAAALMAGRSLQNFAEGAGISIETARTMLKNIFGKTDTHRQGELVAKLSTAFVPWRSEQP